MLAFAGLLASDFLTLSLARLCCLSSPCVLSLHPVRVQMVAKTMNKATARVPFCLVAVTVLRSVLAGALVLTAAACSDSGWLGLFSADDGAADRVVLRGATMGTSWSVIYSASAEVSEEALMASIQSRLEEINASLSTYIDESEISTLNRGELPSPVQLSEDFGRVMDVALVTSQLTGGAYDVTVAPLVDLWGFGPRDFDGTLPTVDAIDEARKSVGFSRLGWRSKERLLELPAGMSVDMSSVAKGYAVDQLADLLMQAGIESMLVEIGGELRAHGERPEGGSWRIAVESPEPTEGRFVAALEVRDRAVATSGDYRNFFEVDGVRYSHLVDPRTGSPVTHELVSVTVVHTSCAVADAMATALIVMGLGDARALAEREGLAAYFVTTTMAGLQVHSTSHFEALAVLEST